MFDIRISNFVAKAFMSRLAFLYPGQGSQYVGMGRDLYESFDEARSLYDKAESILGFPLKQYCFEGPDEELKQTYVTQPALFVHSVVLTKLLLARGIKPVITAGHSLGEYSALGAANVLPFDELLELVKIRGEQMQTAGEKAQGTMFALVGMDDSAVNEICSEASSVGVVTPANFNAPGQVVISGSIKGVNRAVEIAKERGVRRAIELNVSCAFHSQLMENAIEGLVSSIESTNIKPSEIPVVANVNAKPMTNPEEIKQNLGRQLTSPVRWSESVEYISKSGIDAFVEVGAGKVLKGLAKRICKEIPCHTVGTEDEINSISEN